VKLLHTGDWHVGRLIRGRSRADEHRAVLAEITAIAARERVDAVLVVGDLFDSAAPSPESEAIVYDGLLALADTGAAVLILGGNHDSDRRLQALSPLLERSTVITRPVFRKPADGGVVEIASRDGHEIAMVACLPFLSQRWVVKADDLMSGGGAEAHMQYGERVKSLLAALTAGFRPDTVNIVAAHCMVHGATTVGSERSAQTVFEYSVAATAFGSTPHYVALGHLHRQQAVAGPCPIYYAGSPLMLDFGEVGDVKAVMLVDAHPGVPAAATAVPLTAGRRLRVVEGTLDELRGVTGAVGDDWLKVVVREPMRVGLADDVRELLPNAVDVEVAREDDPGRNGMSRQAPVRSGLTPTELFAAYLAEQQVDDPRLSKLFAELYEEASSS
jgi:exonuclease SbcD